MLGYYRFDLRGDWLRPRRPARPAYFEAELLQATVKLGRFTAGKTQNDMSQRIAAARPSGQRIDKRPRPGRKAQPPLIATRPAALIGGDQCRLDDRQSVRRQCAR